MKLTHRLTFVPVLALAGTLGLAACGGSSDPLSTSTGTSGAPGTDTTGSTGGSGTPIVIGSANFPENELLAEIYAAALEDAGVPVTKQLNIGNREAYLAGLEDGSIDLIPEYTGNLTLFLNKDAKATDPEGVYTELEAALPDNLSVLDYAKAEDKDSVVVTKETADKYQLKTIGDLKAEAPNLVLGGPPEWADRHTGVPGLKEVYGLEFKQFRPLSASGNLTVQSLVNGQIDAGNIFSTDPAIVANNFVVLEDNKNLFAAQNVVPLIAKDAVNPTVETQLNDVSAALTTENLTQMMVDVGTNGKDPAEVARTFVDENLGD